MFIFRVVNLNILNIFLFFYIDNWFVKQIVTSNPTTNIIVDVVPDEFIEYKAKFFFVIGFSQYMLFLFNISSNWWLNIPMAKYIV